MSFATHPPETSGRPLAWVEFDDVPILFGNHFLVQHEPDEFVLTVGQVTAPPLVGPSTAPGGQNEVPIHTLARIGLTRNRVAELIALLQSSVEEHDRGR
jgi:hypothetical protein